MEFVRDVYHADSMTSQQIPNIAILNQDLVRIELHTGALKGLSFRDFTLASMIDAMDFKNKYSLVPLEQEQNYKKVIRHLRIEEEMKQLELEIRTSEGIRSKNKFQTSLFNKQFGNDS